MGKTALAICGAVMVVIIMYLGSAKEGKTMNNGRQDALVRAELPALDLVVPVRTETATFAMG